MKTAGTHSEPQADSSTNPIFFFCKSTINFAFARSVPYPGDQADIGSGTSVARACSGEWHVRVSAPAVPRRRRAPRAQDGQNMADRRAAESTLTKSLRDLDYGYSDLCRYVSYSKNKQSEAVSCAPAHARARMLVLARTSC